MQKRIVKFHPVDGELVPGTQFLAADFRPDGWTKNTRSWRFNPWTGWARADTDVSSDPFGLLIWDGESPVGAFKQEASRRNADHIVRAAAGDIPAAAREALHDWAEREALHDWAERNPGAAEAMTVANEVADKLFGPTDPPRDKVHIDKPTSYTATDSKKDFDEGVHALLAATRADRADRVASLLGTKPFDGPQPGPAGHPLQVVFAAAIEQATRGKGVRHGGEATPFLEQPWVHYGKMHGRGFLTGQAAKKLEEAASTRKGEAFIAEALGALVYIGMAILKEREDESL